MRETTDDIRYDIAETRRRVTQTLAELGGEISGRREGASERASAARDSVTTATTQAQASVIGFAREHPWYALGAAVGLGVLIGRSDADTATARGMAGGAAAAAKGVASAATGAAHATVDTARSLVSRDGPSQSVASDAGNGILNRLQAGLMDVVGGTELLAEMRREAGRIA